MKKASHRSVAVALVLTLCLVGTGFFLSVSAAGETVKTRKEARNFHLPLVGKLLVTGAATINSKKALSGTTIFSENRIAVAKTAGNVATITLGRLGRLDLQPGTELVLRFADDLISGELLAGEAVIKSNLGVKVALHTPAGLAAADGREAAAIVASVTHGPEKLGTKTNSVAAHAGAGTVTGAGSSTQLGGFNLPLFSLGLMSCGIAAAIIIPLALDKLDGLDDQTIRELLNSPPQN